MRTDIYIICSAIWVNNGKQYVHQPKNVESGLVMCGRRHHNCFTLLALLFPKLDYKQYRPIQGFLTSDDRFVNRYQGSRIAFKASQIDKITDGMISEELY